MTYWKLPHIYGEETVASSKILPLGFQFQGKEPNPNKFVQRHGWRDILPVTNVAYLHLDVPCIPSWQFRQSKNHFDVHDSRMFHLKAATLHWLVDLEWNFNRLIAKGIQ